MRNALISILIPHYINHEFFRSWQVGQTYDNDWRSVLTLRNHYCESFFVQYMWILWNFVNFNATYIFWTGVINYVRLSAHLFFFYTIQNRIISYPLLKFWWAGQKYDNYWRSVSTLHNHYCNSFCVITCELHEILSTSTQIILFEVT